MWGGEVALPQGFNIPTEANFQHIQSKL